MLLIIGLLHQTRCKVAFGQRLVKVILQDPVLDGLWIDQSGV